MSGPVSFRVGGSSGINLGVTLRKTFTELGGRDDPVLQEAAGAVSCRLLVGLPWFSRRPQELTSVSKQAGHFFLVIPLVESYRRFTPNGRQPHY